MKPPNSGHPNNGHAKNSRQNVKSEMQQSFLNYFPIADNISITNNFLRPAGVQYSDVSL